MEFGGSFGMLTANTLNNEVLPAFWSPIIVISISVALSIEDPWSVSFLHFLDVKSKVNVFFCPAK
jgi:hypothetical protein